MLALLSVRLLQVRGKTSRPRPLNPSSLFSYNRFLRYISNTYLFFLLRKKFGCEKISSISFQFCVHLSEFRYFQEAAISKRLMLQSLYF